MTLNKFLGININTNIIQAGGHQLLQVRDTPVIKPTKLSEVEFYRDYIPKYPELLDLVPKFYGYGLTKDIKDMYSEAEYNLILEKGYTHYIELENLIGHNKFVDIVNNGTLDAGGQSRWDRLHIGRHFITSVKHVITQDRYFNYIETIKPYRIADNVTTTEILPL